MTFTVKFFCNHGDMKIFCLGCILRSDSKMPINHNSVDSLRWQLAQPKPKECLSLVERIVASEQLCRSSRLTKFLRYVCTQTLAGHEEQIDEQKIGMAVFGRAEGYNTSADNIVRVNASDLRKRIDLYFAENSDEPILLTIPRGAYKPVFQFRQSTQIDDATPESANFTTQSVEIAQEESQISSRLSLRIWTKILVVCCMVLSIACIWLVCVNHNLTNQLAPWKTSPELRKFWRPFFQQDTKTDVILADTTFALVEDIIKRQIPLNTYLSGNYAYQFFNEESTDRQEDLALLLPRNFGSVGDFRLAQELLNLAPRGKNLQLYYSREYRPELIQNDNVILIGSRKSNPWSDLFQNRLNFTVEYDPMSKTSSVHNRHPQAGEQMSYSTGTSDAGPSGQSLDGYSVIACLSGASPKTNVLIIAGTSAPATEAAGELLVSGSRLYELEQKLGIFSLHHFEVLLKTSQLSGTPINAKIVAFRNLDNPPR